MPSEGIRTIVGGTSKKAIDNSYAKYIASGPRAVQLTYDEFANAYMEKRRQQHIRQQEQRYGGKEGREKEVKIAKQKLSALEKYQEAYKAKQTQAQLQKLKHLADLKLQQEKEDAIDRRNFVYLSPAEYEARKNEPVKLGDKIKLVDMTEMFRAIGKK